MSLYLDTSCLLKMLFPEPETRRVMQLVAVEEHVVISTLARLETVVRPPDHSNARSGRSLLNGRFAGSPPSNRRTYHEPVRTART